MNIGIGLLGGVLFIWILQTIIDMVFTSRLMDDPFKGKLLATISAYFIIATLVSVVSSSIIAFVTCLPGALLVGWLESRSARKIQARIDAEDENSVFE